MSEITEQILFSGRSTDLSDQESFKCPSDSVENTGIVQFDAQVRLIKSLPLTGQPEVGVDFADAYGVYVIRSPPHCHGRHKSHDRIQLEIQPDSLLRTDLHSQVDVRSFGTRRAGQTHTKSASGSFCRSLRLADHVRRFSVGDGNERIRSTVGNHSAIR